MKSKLSPNAAGLVRPRKRTRTIRKAASASPQAEGKARRRLRRKKRITFKRLGKSSLRRRSDKRRKAVRGGAAASSLIEQAAVVAQESRVNQHALDQSAYEGGEELYEKAIPPGMLLPDVTLQEVIAAGVDSFRPHLLTLLDTGTVYDRIQSALSEGRPLSIVRLGDGELLALAQDLVIDTASIRGAAPFLAYAGIELPNLRARDQLAEAVRNAGIIGVPVSRKKHFQPLLYPVLRAHGLDVRTLPLTISTINFSLHQEGLLTYLLRDRRLLLIGNAAPALAPVLLASGFNVAGVIAPVLGMDDTDRVMEAARAVSFDLALVSAGIPAVVLSWRIAAELGKVSLDFGHTANAIAVGHALL